MLVLSLLSYITACSTRTEESTEFTLSNPNPVIEYENIEVENAIVESTVIEDIAVEEILVEHITEEIYLTETIEVENQISAYLLEDDSIDEVLLCDSVYVSQDNIDEFSNNSQIAELFSDNIEWSIFLKKVAVGTGVIVTLAVVSKSGINGPVATIVASAADRALQFGAGGAVVGSLYGGAIGAVDAIDESGRTSAILAFAAATAGLILASLSFIAVVPSGGTSALTLGVGIQMVIAGVSTISALGASVSASSNWIEAITATEVNTIDWESIDWDQVGVSAAQRAIASGEDGFMWGAIVGAVYGGAEGLNIFETYYAPYSTLRQRLNQTPKNGSLGHWTGKRGESTFVLNEPITLEDGTVITQVEYQNCIPDFSPYERARVTIQGMTNKRYGQGNNFDQADEALAQLWSRTRQDGHTWTADQVAQYRTDNGLTWHEMNNMHEMQLVPQEVNSNFGHFGGCAEYTAMTNQSSPLLNAGEAAVYNEIIDEEEETYE